MSSILDRTPLLVSRRQARQLAAWAKATGYDRPRSEEHTSELQSLV